MTLGHPVGDIMRGVDSEFWVVKSVRGHLSIPLLLLLLPSSHPVDMYPLWSLYISDHLSTSPVPLIDVSILNHLVNSLASNIDHIRIVPHDPTAPSDGQWTSIFGRLGTGRLGIVHFTISSLD
jgi:hypothetical protein